ncbi:MAG: hypothetical protein GXP39_16580 [Chloroflexi bacterium]|nr:hypothetical protein [Chloroflexota bacterium]
MRSRNIPPRGWTFEYLMWIFTRLSGLTMLLLAALGMTAAFIMGARTQMDLPTLMRWTFFPNPNHVMESDIPDITQGWSNAFWQIMQMLLVFFAVTHGFNGLRVVIEDYIDHSLLRPMLRGVIFLLWLFSIAVAIYVILAS